MIVPDGVQALVARVIASLDKTCPACLAATDAETWELLHQGRSCPVDRAVAACGHPEHRRGTRGGLRPSQEVCMNCGDVVLKRRPR